MRPLSERLELQAKVAMTTELEKLLREAAALAKRYEDAPVGFVMGQGLLTEGAAAIVQTENPGDVKGQRVRLVVEGGE